MATKATKATKAHEWTNGGDRVLILRRTGPDGTAHGGLQYPPGVGVEVVAPDWSPVAECGGGLHGWP
jgi:hypothetical protein